MENVICKANIKPKKAKIAIIFIVIALILYSSICYIVRVEHSRWGYYGYNFLGENVCSSNIDEGFHPIECIYNLVCRFSWCPISGVIFYISCLCLIIGICIIFASLRSFSVAKNCSLVLENTGIIGAKAGLFSSKEIKLPTEKIDSITVQNGIFDKIFGGKTIAVRSASGLIKFPWVQNANEFVNATLAKIEGFKQSVKNENQNLVSAMAKSIGGNTGNSSAAQQIKEIKDLLDSGLITQEEFEAKRKELLDKM